MAGPLSFNAPIDIPISDAGANTTNQSRQIFTHFQAQGHFATTIICLFYIYIAK